jgi:hypothetical protein
MIKKFFRGVWFYIEAISEGRTMRVNKQVSKIVKDR